MAGLKMYQLSTSKEYSFKVLCMILDKLGARKSGTKAQFGPLLYGELWLWAAGQGNSTTCMIADKSCTSDLKSCWNA